MADPVEHAGDLGVVGEEDHALAVGDAALLDVADFEGGGDPVSERELLAHGGERGIGERFVVHDAAIQHGGGEEAAFHRRAGGEDAAIVEEAGDHRLDAHLLELAAVRRRERREGAHEEVQAGLRDEIREELAQADFDGEEAAEAHAGGEAGERLGDEEVQIIDGGAFDVPFAMRELEERLVVKDEAGVGAAAEGIEREDGVVGLRDDAGDLRRGQHGAGEHGDLAVFFLQRLDEQRAEAGAAAAARGVQDDDAADIVALVDFDIETAHHLREHLATSAEVSDGEVATCALGAGDEIGGIEERAGVRADIFDHAGLQIDHDGPRDEAAAATITEAGEKGAPVSAWLLALRSLPGQRVDAMLLAKGFPKRGSDLIARLADGYDDNIVDLHLMCFS